jgi:hypothetical protein
MPFGGQRLGLNRIEWLCVALIGIVSGMTLFQSLASAQVATGDSTVNPAQEPRWWGYDPKAASVPFPYIYEPTNSWVYPEIDRQIALGNLSELAFLSRPLPRSLIAARVAEALASGRRSTGLDRLARELAWEGRMMGLGFAYRDSRPMITIGPPESQVKLNGALGAGGAFTLDAPPDFNEKTFASIRGLYWHPSGFSMSGEYMVTQIPNAEAFGDPVVSDTEIQLWVPRASIAWHGSVFEVWLGRENQRWGPGRSGGLLLGGGTDPYTQLSARVHAGTFATLSAVHGWLSQARGQYMAFHRVELNLGKGLRFGVGEGVRYDGQAPEPLYVLNLMPYAVVERILTAESNASAAERDSLTRSNYIADVDLYWRFASGWAAYGELMVDDLKPSGDGPTRLAYQLGFTRAHEGWTLQTEYTQVYNYTYQVFYNRNFVHRGEVLGYPLGADVGNLNLWADLELNLAWSVGASAHHTRTGEGNGAGAWCNPEQATDNPFGTNCQTFGEASGSQFAGIVERSVGFTGSVTLAPRDNVRFEGQAGVDFVQNADHVDGASRTRPLGRVLATWRW